MKVKEKFLLSVIGISMICLILNPIKSKAALQANGNPGKADTINNWLINIRKMESTGGTLGLAGEVGSNLDTTGTPNNLDIHMQKNTEYGAMAILSASAYGKQGKVADGESTTGNKSGIYINLNKEWVAAGHSTLEIANFKNAVGKYKNVYESSYVAKIGDAVSETAGWHGSGASQWFKGRFPHLAGLVRAYSGSIFSYYGEHNETFTSGSITHYDASYVKSWRSRAVVVIGSGY